jgi:hypothetical protein
MQGKSRVFGWEPWDPISHASCQLIRRVLGKDMCGSEEKRENV